MDKEYGMVFVVTDMMRAQIGDQKAYEMARADIEDVMFKSVIQPTIGDGQHHVFYSKYFQERDPMMRATNYYISMRHSIAQMQHINILSAIPQDAVPSCRWCGNVLTLDKRGGCSACGGPGGNHE